MDPGCWNCRGSGVCSYCKGKGYDIVTNGYNRCPCCWGSGVEGTGDPNYRDYYPDPTA